MTLGPSTRAVHAGLGAGEQGTPLLGGPVLAAANSEQIAARIEAVRSLRA